MCKADSYYSCSSFLIYLYIYAIHSEQIESLAEKMIEASERMKVSESKRQDMESEIARVKSAYSEAARALEVQILHHDPAMGHP